MGKKNKGKNGKRGNNAPNMKNPAPEQTNMIEKPSQGPGVKNK